MKPHDDRKAISNHKKAEQLSKQAEADKNEMIKEMIKTRQGRAFLWWILEITGLNQSPMTSNALFISYNTGKGDIGREILANILEVSPNGYLEMLKEKQDEQAAEARRSRDEELNDDEIN